MVDTIRQRLLDAIETKVKEIRISNGYRTDCGKNVDLYRTQHLTVPAVSIWPELEAVNQDDYQHDYHTLPIKVEAVMQEENQTRNEVYEKMLGDIIENITGDKWTLSFTSGGTSIPSPGDLVEGQTSGATAYIESITVDTGAWADGDAAGSFVLRKKTGTFEGEDIDIGGVSNLATTDGTVTVESHLASTSDDLSDDIYMILAGIETYQGTDKDILGSSATFEVKYWTVRGNPYAQP